jgi:hypothetical protein
LFSSVRSLGYNLSSRFRAFQSLGYDNPDLNSNLPLYFDFVTLQKKKTKKKRDEIERMKTEKERMRRAQFFRVSPTPSNRNTVRASKLLCRQARVPNAVPSPAGLSSLSKPLLTSNPQQTPPRQPLQNPGRFNQPASS